MKEEQIKSLGGHLKNLRVGLELTLRGVEKATDKKVSNGYLSQLENGQIQNPSPNILHTLSRVYNVEYQSLMEKAGYITSETREDDSSKHGRVATYAVENLTSDEEQELLKYLEYYRKKGR